MQSKKPAIFHSYRRADALAHKLAIIAENAKQDTVTGREQARVAAVRKATEAASAMAAARSSLAAAVGHAGAHGQLATIRTELAGADSNLDQARRLIDQGKFKEAKELAERAGRTAIDQQGLILKVATTLVTPP